MKSTITLVAAVVMVSSLTTPGASAARASCGTRTVTPYGVWTRKPLPATPAPQGRDPLTQSAGHVVSYYAVDSTNPRNVFVADEWTVMASHDGGCTWAPELSFYDGGEAQASTHIISLVATGIPDRPVYALVRRGFQDGYSAYADLTSELELRDAEGQWSTRPLTLEDGTPVLGAAERLIVAPSDPSTLYLVADISEGQSEQLLYASNDHGQSWQRRGVYAPAYVFEPPACAAGANLCSDISFEYLSVDPLDANKLWASAYEGVFTSSDGGRTWSEAAPFDYDASEGGIQWIDVAHEPGRPARIVVFGFTRNLWSIDGGETWAIKDGTGMDDTTGRSYSGIHVDSSVSAGGELMMVTATGQVLSIRDKAWVDVSPPWWGCDSPTADYMRDHVCLGDVTNPAPSTFAFLSQSQLDLRVGDGRFFLTFHRSSR